MENKKGTPEGAPIAQENNTPKYKRTQADILLDEWEKGEEVGQLEAITKLGIGHLSSLVSKMIHIYLIKGIRKIDRVSSTGAHYTDYYMAHEDVKAARERLREIQGC